MLMSEFFAAMAGGQPRSAALRAAQLKLIEAARNQFESAHPYYWAAFNLTGI